MSPISELAKHWITSILLLTSIYNCVGQSKPNIEHEYAKEQRRISILSGYNFWASHYLEFGIAKNQYRKVGAHPFTSASFLSTEIRIDNSFLIGPKIGAWMSGGMSGLAMGVNLIYYTDFAQESLRLRPEMGIGVGKWKVVYGYNIPLTNGSFEAVNRSNIGIVCLIGVRKIDKDMQ